VSQCLLVAKKRAKKRENVRDVKARESNARRTSKSWATGPLPSDTPTNQQRRSTRPASSPGVRFANTAPPGGAQSPPGSPGKEGQGPAPAPPPERPHTKAWLRQNRTSVSARTTAASTARKVTTLRSAREVQRARIEAEEYEEASQVKAGTFRHTAFSGRSPPGRSPGLASTQNDLSRSSEADSQFGGGAGALQSAIRAVKAARAARAEKGRGGGGFVNTI